MKFDSEARKTINSYLQNPEDSRSQYELGSLYWSILIERTGELLREQQSIDKLVDSERLFLDYGVLDEIIDCKNPIRGGLIHKPSEFDHLKIYSFSQWLKDTVKSICEGDRKKYMQRDIMAAEIQMQRIEKEIAINQDSRAQLLRKNLAETEQAKAKVDAQAKKLVETDQLNLQNLRTKKAIAGGTFFSVDQRREYVQRENDLQKQLQRKENLYTRVKSQEDKRALNDLEKRVMELSKAVVDLEETIRRLEQEMQEIEQKQNAVSPMEIANRVSREIEYVRDLVKLTAKRLRLESCAVLKPGDKFFTFEALEACLGRVLEFDPRIFCNARVTYLGRPSILLAPGNGNAIYDWKNNQLIIPTVPPNGNFIGSIATAMIEYRLDVDEDKLLLGSFAKLPSQKGTKSLFQLKERLVKAYITWMTSEYKGFRVLSKEIKNWFEHEIAPNRNDIYCPPHLQSFNLSSKEIRELMERTVSRIGEGGSPENSEDFCTAGILFFQQGEYDKAFEYIKTYIQKQPESVFGYYNLGHAAMKVSRKQDAIAAFSEFIKRNAQTWWAATARDHVRRLQIG